MARAIKQYRYFNDNNENNQPLNTTSLDYISGAVFEVPSCYPILQLGIQTLPGTKFYVNYGIDPIIVGFTGIYELDLENQAEIVHLTFDKDSIETIKNNGNGYLIIDILYDNGIEEE